MQLTVESVTTAKTGKSLRVKANGEWYGAKKDSGITQGMVIDAEVSDGDFGKWIDKWRALSNGNGTSKPAASLINVSGAPAWLPFASNTVAHAIDAGLVKEPAGVEMWVAAAKAAFEKHA